MALAFSRTGFPGAGNHASDVTGGDDLSLTFSGIDENCLPPRRDQTIIGMFNVETFAVGGKNGVRLERRRPLQSLDFFCNHGPHDSFNLLLKRENFLGLI